MKKSRLAKIPAWALSLMTLVVLIMYIFTDFATLSNLIFWISLFVLSVAGAIVGARTGQRIIDQAK